MLIINEDTAPGKILAMGYIIVITIGTIFLLLPISTANGNTTTILDALFTATSATAVTGLIVVNTAEHWTRFGQIVIMVLIQVGGLGFMTTTTMLFFIFGKKISLRERLIIMEELNYKKISGVIALSKYIIIITFLIEFIGACLLFLYFQNIMSLKNAVFYSFFHSISAFNNAGFALFANSLENFVLSPYINIVIPLLFIIGGLGFVVLEEIFYKKKFKKLSLHSKLVIYMTIFLILIGTLSVFILEFNNPDTIGNLDIAGKILASFFQGVTPRTAGFNTIDIANMKDVTLFIIIVLMFIGASPGSTGGGIKTTTAGTLLVTVYNMASGKDDIEIARRRLKERDIYKALSVVVISLLLLILIIIVLTFTENFTFIQIFFEVFSAFATVGLSTGISSELSIIGRLFIIITMFIGRVGPFTLAMALGRRYCKGIRYPEEDILIG
ncbi:TrkH family potassium uptake protein [Natronospora cellulosivora (SeqCode)]